MQLDNLGRTICSNVSCECNVNSVNITGLEGKSFNITQAIAKIFFDIAHNDKDDECHIFTSAVDRLLSEAKEYKVYLDPLPASVACCFQRAVGVRDYKNAIYLVQIFLGAGLIWGRDWVQPNASYKSYTRYAMVAVGVYNLFMGVWGLRYSVIDTM